MDCNAFTPRRPGELPFLAEPEAVAALRRLLRIHLGLWGLPELTEAAQLCVSELVGNVIRHVGSGTPATLAVFVKDTCLRIEVRDPDTRALPTLVESVEDAESGRGMVLVAACSDRWGTQLMPGHKVTWVELAVAGTGSIGHRGSVPVSGTVWLARDEARRAQNQAYSKLTSVVEETAAIEAIADLLLWLGAQGHDVDEILDRAQRRCDKESGRTAR
ncbi:ATP-binding protein [Streptomyces sp. NPDC047028]|uniref:ATP-binding protein n=1 Tax=Streptomyces sp. NPDC047028 TaxID=3155793 RepID=UPI0033C92FD3